MKNFLKLVVVFVGLLTLSVACGDKNEPSNPDEFSKSTLIGKWEVLSIKFKNKEIYDGQKKMYFIFNENGTVTLEPNPENEKVTYKVEGMHLIMNYEANAETPAYTEDNTIDKFGGGMMEFSKADIDDAQFAPRTVMKLKKVK